jgi:hypothetical protein
MVLPLTSPIADLAKCGLAPWAYLLSSVKEGEVPKFHFKFFYHIMDPGGWGGTMGVEVGWGGEVIPST